MKYLFWALLFPLTFLIGLVARLLSPFACLFINREPYFTSVKRYGRQLLVLDRDRLVWWLTWLDTFDNATDEYFYSLYGNSAKTSQKAYDNSRLIRWWYRVLWLQRNSAYTFIYKFFSLSNDSKWAWSYENDKYNIYIGWKPKGDRLMYSGRIISFKRPAA